MKDLKEIFDTCILYGIQQRENEFTKLLEIIQERKYKSVLEIGAYSSGSTYGFSQICESVLSVDLLHRANLGLKNVKYIQGNSQDKQIIDEIWKQGKRDAIVIDGDHGYFGVKQDYLNYKDLLNPGGIITFHDIWNSEECTRQNCYVFEFWDEIKQKFEHLEIGEVKTWGGIGVLLNVK